MTTAPGGEVRAYYHRVLPYFEQELADRGDAPLWQWAAPQGCRVLELGAGTGRATAFLARTAARVVAFDLAPELLAVARRRLAGASNVVLLAADMREIAFRSRFDLVAAVDDPFVHLTEDEDRDRAFGAAARHLATGGRFLLDAAWLSPQQREAAARPEGLLLERRGRGDLVVREVWRCDPRTRVCSAYFEYHRGERTVERVSFPARLWSTDEVEQRATTSGLRIANLWGDYDRRPWDREKSPRLIADLRSFGETPETR
jgi:SAM-dependent methyltransferase